MSTVQRSSRARAFTAWWGTNVTPGKDAGLKHRSPRTGTTIPAADATGQTGISKQQVNRWNTRLEDEPAYREPLT